MAVSLDLLNPSNYIIINLCNVKLLGLYGAVYCSEIFDKMKKIALIKSYQVTIDREDVAERLGIPVSEQKAIEERWEVLNLLKPVEGTENVFTVNVDKFYNYLVATYTKDLNKEEIKKFKDKCKIKDKDTKEAARHKIVESIKAGIACPNMTVREKVCEWIEFVTDAGRKLSIKSAQAFIDRIIEYSNGDEQVMIKIIQSAISSTYTNVDYAIHAYEVGLKNRKANMSADFRRATNEDMEKGSSW